MGIEQMLNNPATVNHNDARESLDVVGMLARTVRDRVDAPAERKPAATAGTIKTEEVNSIIRYMNQGRTSHFLMA